jgi:hypothetical protein
VQIVGDDHSAEAPVAERPWTAVFQIGRDRVYAGKPLQRRNVAVNRDDRVFPVQEKTAVAAAAGRNVKDGSTSRDEVGEPHHPGGGRRDIVTTGLRRHVRSIT